MKKVGVAWEHSGVITALPSNHSSECHMTTEEPTIKKHPEKRSGTGIAWYKYSWKKMKAAAKNRDEYGEEWKVTDVPSEATWLKSKSSQSCNINHITSYTYLLSQPHLNQQAVFGENMCNCSKIGKKVFYTL